MEKSNWGGAREGAGRPKSDNPRKMRGLKFNDEEWAVITAKAKAQGLSVRKYLYSLAKRDPSV
ncbi:MAG: hypothetical protein LBH75_04155 [Treponema sp.]|jgi:hypothetical protein|nr:hypothetical protein [Treponema sp.]